MDIENVAVFIDDMLVVPQAEEEHFETIDKVLQILEKRTIIINENKKPELECATVRSKSIHLYFHTLILLL